MHYCCLPPKINEQARSYSNSTGSGRLSIEILVSNLGEFEFNYSDEMFKLIDEIISEASDNLKESKMKLSRVMNKIKQATQRAQ
jgi:hypothetical protein